MLRCAVRPIGAVVFIVLFIQCQPARAQSLDVRQEPPPAFPRVGATRVLENDWGTVWDVIWAPGSATPMHRHGFDYVGVELANSTFSTVTPDGQRRTLTAKTGASWFLQRGVTHIEEVPSGSPARHAVVIDLKDAAEPSFVNSSGSPIAFAEGVAAKVDENQRVVRWDYTWPTGENAPARFYGKNAFIIFVDGGELTSSVAGRRPQSLLVSAGQVLFRPGGSALSERSTRGNVRGIIIELK
jgi:hypothetical protein